MEEQYSILRELLEVEHRQNALLFILDALETAYSEQQQEEMDLLVNHTRGCIKAIQGDLRGAISKLDSCILEAARQK